MMVYRIDPELTGGPPDLPADKHGPRPVAIVEDSAGRRAYFVATELIVQRSEDLDDVLEATKGAAVLTDEVPPPPRGLDGIRETDRSATLWVIRVDPSSFPLDAFDKDLDAIGADGDGRVSSELGARLLAMATRLRLEGKLVGPNFVLSPNLLPLTSSSERAGLDAYGLAEYQATGFKSSVAIAWQFFQAYSLLRPLGTVRVAIIDGGFWLDPKGDALSQDGGASDLPQHPIQFDFIGDDYQAGGASGASNSKGTPTPWHGNGSASAAVATINNNAGAAGTGGFCAEPVLFNIDFSYPHWRRALRTATAWGAEIVNMSFGAPTNWWWRTFIDQGNTVFPFEEARIYGVTVVASAGNDTQDVDDEDVYPCTAHSSVVCVGALDNSTRAANYSNYGSSVDIWAPGTVTAMPDGTMSGNISFGGTSAAAPFVAGVAAMLRAVDRQLYAERVSDVLAKTGWRDSPDPKVPVYLNAYAALLDVAGRSLPADRFEGNNDPSVATELQLANGAGRWETLAISSATDRDWFRIRFDDYVSIDIDVNYVAALGSLTVAVLAEDPSLGIEGAATNPTATGIRYHADLLPPGSYSIAIRGTAANVYDLAIQALAANLQPDEFEPNDTLATFKQLPAKPLGHWMKNANLHRVGDVDYYHFDGARVEGSVAFDFAIEASDADLTLRLYNDQGVEVRAAGPSRNPSLRISTTEATVKVESDGRRARYIMAYGYRLTDKHLQDGLRTKQPYLYDPGDPAPRWLRGREVVLVFTAPKQLTDRSRIELRTDSPDLHVALVGLDGHVLAEGQRLGDLETGEALSAKALVAGTSYALRVVRRSSKGPGDAIRQPVAFKLRFRR